MNKKGFTLVEILAVIVIIGVLMIVVIPNVQEIVSSGKHELVEINKDQIEDAAKVMVNEVIYCEMSNDTKKLLGNSCSDAESKLINGISLDITKLNIDDVSGNCSGEVDIKVERNTYRVTVNTDRVKCAFYSEED